VLVEVLNGRHSTGLLGTHDEEVDQGTSVFPKCRFGWGFATAATSARTTAGTTAGGSSGVGATCAAFRLNSMSGERAARRACELGPSKGRRDGAGVRVPCW
jgi:hypothetical protein